MMRHTLVCRAIHYAVGDMVLSENVWRFWSQKDMERWLGMIGEQRKMVTMVEIGREVLIVL